VKIITFIASNFKCQFCFLAVIFNQNSSENSGGNSSENSDENLTESSIKKD
jgi:hypothetical protein